MCFRATLYSRGADAAAQHDALGGRTRAFGLVFTLRRVVPFLRRSTIMPPLVTRGGRKQSAKNSAALIPVRIVRLIERRIREWRPTVLGERVADSAGADGTERDVRGGEREEQNQYLPGCIQCHQKHACNRHLHGVGRVYGTSCDNTVFDCKLKIQVGLR